MKSQINHVQVNINYKNVGFYKRLMELLGWSVVIELPNEKLVGFADPQDNTSVWYVQSKKSSRQDYDGMGINHIGIGVARQSEVDTINKFLDREKIKALFETPRHRPDFSENDKSTYYQVMFESPDKVLFEVVYTGPRS